jgi:hypothetical protein
MMERSGRWHDRAARLPVLAAGLLALAVLFGPAASRADEVTVSGCPRAGVEAGCITLTTADGTVYDLTAAEPKPEVGIAGTASGTVSQSVSLCMQGIVLKPATWQPTPGAVCAAPKLQ